VGADGEQLGVMDTVAALRMANELDLDLVEVAPMARPPVAKLMDYSKYKYEQAIKAKEARRKQSLVVLKEMKMRPKIDQHDYETKKGHVERFLRQGHKVKVTIMFRGREMAHTELGRRLLERLATDISDIAQVDSPARQDGRNMIAVFSPRKSAITAPRSAHQADRPAPGRPAERGGPAPASPSRPPAGPASTRRTAPVSAP
jgi:translation initiation factor IF-3